MLQQIAAAFGPILAYAFALLDQKGKLAGWRWIFVSAKFPPRKSRFNSFSGSRRSHHVVVGNRDVVLDS
jgi:hypothetical protein